MASRPAQGNNSNRPFNRPSPAYLPDAAPKVTGRGTLSNPAKPPRPAYQTDVPNKAPTVVSL